MYGGFVRQVSSGKIRLQNRFLIIILSYNMKTENLKELAYRGFIITSVTEIREESDVVEDKLFPWYTQVQRSEIGIPRDKVYIKAISKSSFGTISHAKTYIDRVMSQEIDHHYPECSPARYYHLSHCTNPKVTCQECILNNYGYDCRNNKILKNDLK